MENRSLFLDSGSLFVCLFVCFDWSLFYKLFFLGHCSLIKNKTQTALKCLKLSTNCNEFYIGKTKSRLHDRKTEHFKAVSKSDHTLAIADHMKTTGHKIKWDHFDILASGKTDFHCKIKETLLIQEQQPSLNAYQEKRIRFENNRYCLRV